VRTEDEECDRQNQIERHDRVSVDATVAAMAQIVTDMNSTYKDGSEADWRCRSRSADHIHMEPKHEKYERLIARCKSLDPVACAVVHPCDESSLRAAVEAGQEGLITPILVGPEAKIKRVAAEAKLDLTGLSIVDAPHSEAAAEAAVRLAREGKVEALMKGSLHTDELMAAVVKRENGMRTNRRISHCFVMDVPALEQALIITDCAINIAPTLQDKVHIIQNAIDLAHVFGRTMPRVAILSAMETVNPSVPSTIEAGALCKMADRGQITGGDPRRSAGGRQRDQSDRGTHQAHRVAGRGARRHPGGAGSRGGQHARQEPHVHGRSRCRRYRPGRSRADHLDQSCRFVDCPPGLVRGRRADCTRAARAVREGRVVNGKGILVLNAGSSSIKFLLYEHRDGSLEPKLRGQIEGIHTSPRLRRAHREGVSSPRKELGRRRDARSRWRGRISCGFPPP
jgi:hypothetical protein